MAMMADYVYILLPMMMKEVIVTIRRMVANDDDKGGDSHIREIDNIII